MSDQQVNDRINLPMTIRGLELMTIKEQTQYQTN